MVRMWAEQVDHAGVGRAGGRSRDRRPSGLLPRKLAAERTPPPPVVGVVAARRMTVPVMAEPIGTTSGTPGDLRPRPRARVPQGDPLQGRCRRQEGPLLFVIDEEPFKARLADAQAALEQAEAALQKARRLQGAGSRRRSSHWGKRCSTSPWWRSAANGSSSAQGLQCRGRSAQAGAPPERRGPGRRVQGQPRPGEGRLRYGHHCPRPVRDPDLLRPRRAADRLRSSIGGACCPGARR